MKNTFTNKLTVTVLLASLAFLSLNASAGQDSNQRFIIEQVIKLKQAKAAEMSKQEAIQQAECMKQMEQSKNASGS